MECAKPYVYGNCYVCGEVTVHVTMHVTVYGKSGKIKFANCDTVIY